MVKLEYDNTRISVPESWDDITLGFYESFYDEEPSTARERVEWVARICNVDSELLLEWPSEVFNRIVGYLDFLFKNNPAEPSPTIEVEGVKFIVPIEEELTLGAWVDIDEVQKQGKNVLSNVLAIVCRPVGEKYDCKNNDERREMFAALPVSKVLGVLAFFLYCKDVCDLRIQTFSNLAQACDRLPRNTEGFRYPGGGIRLSRIWREMTYRTLTVLLRYRLQKFLRTYYTAETRNTPKKRKES